MPRLVAIEWGSREARVASARTRGSEVIFEHAFAIDLQPRDPGQTFADTDVGQRISAALAARGIGRSETLVAVGRASIELRQLTLPPAPPEELPEIVRFQALRQFTTINEQWPIDFVEVDAGGSESKEVIAAAISPEMVAQIRSTCEAGDLTPKRLILRPFAAASLYRRRNQRAKESCCLMVDLLVEEADLTVMLNDQVVLMRTVRLSVTTDPTAQARALLGEIRRTMAAGRNQLRGRRIESVVLCGSGEEQASLQSLVETELAHPVTTFDPFGELQFGGDLKNQRPESPGRFAPLIGMLLDEVDGTQHAIDFLHPRRRTEPPNRLLRIGLIAGVAVAACLALAFVSWNELAKLDNRVNELALQSKELDTSVERARERISETTLVEQFVESDFGWLDELYTLSAELPPAEDVIVSQLIMTLRSPSGAQMIVDGYARDPEHIQNLQAALRANDRAVLSKGGSDDPRQETYRWQYKETVELQPRVVDPPAPLSASSDAATPDEQDKQDEQSEQDE